MSHHVRLSGDAGTQRVGLLDVGGALVRGDVTLRDLASEPAALRSARSTTQALSARLTTVKTALGVGGGEEPERGPRSRGKTIIHTQPHNTMEYVTKVVDQSAEVAVHGACEEPVCLEPCIARYPACEQFWQPAEYATRFAKQAELDEKAHLLGGGRVMFGLHDYESSGWRIQDPVGSKPDPEIKATLKLEECAHRKTLERRYCLRVSKEDLPGTNHTVVKFLRSVIRCEHVNILRCREVLEDEDEVYMLYEFYPCITLKSFLEKKPKLSQEQLVSIMQECCAAVGYATAANLHLIGWTLAHVLLPLSALHGDVKIVKVFGFGLLGTCWKDTDERLFWSPEALDRQQRSGPGSNFVPKLEPAVQCCCDSWSLGAIAFMLIARRPPFDSEQEVMHKSWKFAASFDEIDPEAKWFVESLMHASISRRLKAADAMHDPWIRRRWDMPRNGPDIYEKVSMFVASSLANRVFGKFLARFMDASTMRRVARYYSAMDLNGHGVITLQVLQRHAKSLEKAMQAAAWERARNYHGVHAPPAEEPSAPLATPQQVFEYLSSEGSEYVSLGRFAEAFAERESDGPSLRLAFESIDEDGSEFINIGELTEVLQKVNEEITEDNVEHHLKMMKKKAEKAKEADIHLQQHLDKSKRNSQGKDSMDWGVNDSAEHKEEEIPGGTVITSAEFQLLFPLYVERMENMLTRVEEARDWGKERAKLYKEHMRTIGDWIKALAAHKKNLAHMAIDMDDTKKMNVQLAMKVKRLVADVGDALKHPPGPKSPFRDNMGRDKHVKIKDENKRWNITSFMDDQAVFERWDKLIDGELHNVKTRWKVSSTGKMIHFSQALQSVQMIGAKLEHVVNWTSGQQDETKAICRVFEEPEVLLPTLPHSSRQLRARTGDEDAQDNQDDGLDLGDEQHGFLYQMLALFRGPKRRSSLN